jgi:hypothetical protein
MPEPHPGAYGASRAGNAPPDQAIAASTEAVGGSVLHVWREYLSALLTTAEYAAVRGDAKLKDHVKILLVWFLDKHSSIDSNLDQQANLAIDDLEVASAVDVAARLRLRRAAVGHPGFH